MKKVLLVTRCFPSDLETMGHGIYVRLKNIVSSLAQNDTRLTIIFLVTDLEWHLSLIKDPLWVQRLYSYFGCEFEIVFRELQPKKASVYFQGLIVSFRAVFDISLLEDFSLKLTDKSLTEIKRDLSVEYDVVFIHRLNSCLAFLQSKIKIKSRVLFDLDDIEYVAYARGILQPPFWKGKLVRYLHLPIIFLYTVLAIRSAAVTFVCSDLDVQKLRFLSKKRSVVSLPNAVPVPLINSGMKVDACTLLFVGTFEYPPNVVAVEYFLDEIWPLIKSELPQSEFLCVGLRPNNIKHYSNHLDGVRFLGYVPSLVDVYRAAKVVICPILSGGGTRVKIVEAAAFGKPVVSTTAGAEGLDFIDGSELVIKDSSKSFAAACLRLLESDFEANKIGAAAFSKYLNLYTKSAFVQKLRSYI